MPHRADVQRLAGDPSADSCGRAAARDNRIAAVRLRSPDMSVRLIPRDQGFYALFVDQAAIAAEAARVLEADLREFRDPAAAADEIQALEHRADDTNHAVLKRLEATFVLPFDHHEIQTLTTRLDDIVDLTEKIADMLVLYGVKAPPPGAADQASILVEACDVIVDGMARLSDRTDLRPFATKIHALEKRGDEIWRANISNLFEAPDDAQAVLTGEDIYDGLEAVIDAADRVGRMLGELASTPEGPW